MEFQVLGPLEVHHHFGPVAITARQQRALLAALLLHAGQVVSAERLIELLWAPAPPDRARASLHAHVSRLRKALQPPGPSEPAALLRTTAAGYVLAVPPGALDLERFRDLAAQGRQALAAGRLEQGAAQLGQALALWRGPVLADVGAARWWARAQGLEEERWGAVQARVQAELGLGRHAELVGELEALVGEQPLRERLWGLLMLALYRSGRQAEALAAYRRARGRLVEELGIEPGVELQRLHRQVLTADPGLGGPAASLARVAWQLAAAVRPFFDLRKHWSDWQTVCEAAVQAAQRTGDRPAAARALKDLGVIHGQQRRYQQAIGCLQHSLAISRQLGDLRGQGLTLHVIGEAYREQGRHRDAIRCHERSLAILRQVGDPWGEAMALWKLRLAIAAVQSADAAGQHWARALGIFQRLGAPQVDELQALFAEQVSR